MAAPGLSCGTQDLPCSVRALSCGMWDLVPWPGMEPGPPALGARSLNHWTTREVPIFILKSSFSSPRIWVWKMLWNTEVGKSGCDVGYMLIAGMILLFRFYLQCIFAFPNVLCKLWLAKTIMILKFLLLSETISLTHSAKIMSSVNKASEKVNWYFIY